MKKFIQVILIFLSFCCFGLGAAYAEHGLFINKFTLVSKKRINRVIFEYVYRAEVINSGFDAEMVSATLTIESPNHTTVVDGQVDPGDAGKQTLLGIDSDNDGVRDDIQRYIYLAYPDKKNVRLALTDITKTYQGLFSFLKPA